SEPILTTILCASFKLPEDGSAPSLYLWNRLQYYVDRELDTHRGRDYKRGSRDLLASFDSPARAIRCASAIARYAAGLGIEVTCGLHAGECEIIGDRIEGIAVETARKIQTMANSQEVLVSSTLRDLVVGSGLCFQPSGVLVCGSTQILPILSLDRERGNV